MTINENKCDEMELMIWEVINARNEINEMDWNEMVGNKWNENKWKMLIEIKCGGRFIKTL